MSRVERPEAFSVSGSLRRQVVKQAEDIGNWIGYQRHRAGVRFLVWRIIARGPLERFFLGRFAPVDGHSGVVDGAYNWGILRKRGARFVLGKFCTYEYGTEQWDRWSRCWHLSEYWSALEIPTVPREVMRVRVRKLSVTYVAPPRGAFRELVLARMRHGEAPEQVIRLGPEFHPNPCRPLKLWQIVERVQKWCPDLQHGEKWSPDL